MTLKTAVKTASSTPWIVGLVVATLCALALLAYWRGDLTLEVLLLALGIGVPTAGGVAYSERKAKREA